MRISHKSVKSGLCIYINFVSRGIIFSFQFLKLECVSVKIIGLFFCLVSFTNIVGFLQIQGDWTRQSHNNVNYWFRYYETRIDNHTVMLKNGTLQGQNFEWSNIFKVL